MPPMASPRRRGSRSRFGQLNPAFAAAHGINSPPPASTAAATEKTGEEKSEKSAAQIIPISASPVQQPPTSKPHVPAGLDQVKNAIGRARTSGKLQVSDAGLETPLPKILFEFPSLADTVDLSLDNNNSTNPNQLKAWESHLAETLGLVDFSDNEGITEFPNFPVAQESQHTSDNSVERFRSVQVFRARRCNLDKFPVTPTLAESWSQLLTLDLSGNKLKGEFALLHLPKTIRELDLSGNRLTSLKSSKDPSTSIDLPKLVSLDISMNEIASTGISPVMHVPCLQRINVGHNQIFNLNFILKSISSSEKSLTTLNAPKTMLSDLDGRQRIDLTAFVSLLSVDLSGNSLCKVPKIPSALQRLNANDNEIQGMEGLLMDDATDSSLVVLQIQRNKLKELDSETLVKLIQLNKLDLQFNSLSSLPLVLGQLTNLQQMYLEGNNLNSLRSSGVRGDLNDTKNILMRLRNRAKADHDASEVDTVPSFGSSQSGKSKGSTRSTKASNAEPSGLLSSVLVGTKVLNYEGKHAHMLPFQLLEELKSSSPDIVQNIDRFNVAKNQLQTIESDWFSVLQQVSILEAQDNRLNTLPANIRELGLSQMHLSKNSLTSHALQFSILQTSTKSNMMTDTLEVLDLSANHLDAFAPELLRQFKSLRNLNLSGNRIISLKSIVDAPHPPECPALEQLNLSENRIEDLGGDEFALLLKLGCPKLQTLRLENNEAEKIPMTLGLLENLKTFDLRGNPQRMIRYDVLDKSTSDVLQYMRNRMTAKTKERVRLKIEELRNASANEPELNFSVAAPTTPPPPTAAKTEHVAAAPAPPVQPSRNMRQAMMTDYASPTKKEVKAIPRISSRERVSATKKSTAVVSRATVMPSATIRATPNKSTPSKSTPTKSTPTKAASPGGSPRPSRIPTPKSRQGLSPVTLSSNSPNTKPRISATGNKTSKGKSPSKNDAGMTSSLLQELEKSIEELAAEMDRPGLSEPKRYAIKKKLAMERSKRLREERRLKQELAHSGIY